MSLEIKFRVKEGGNLYSGPHVEAFATYNGEEIATGEPIYALYFNVHALALMSLGKAMDNQKVWEKLNNPIIKARK